MALFPEFLRPGWLLLALFSPLLVWLCGRARVSASRWRRVCDAHLLPHVLERDRDRPGRGIAAPVAAAWLIAVVALAGPSFGPAFQDTTLMPARVLVIELAPRAMDPATLARAQQTAYRLVTSDDGVPTGLVVYAGEAFVVTPVAEDPNLLAHYLPALAPELLPLDGRRPSRGLDIAATLLTGAARGAGEIVLIASDDGDGEAATSLPRLRRHGHVLSVIDTGPGGTRAASSLRALADAGGGHYARAHEAEHWPGLQGARATGVARTARDDGPWLLLAALPLVLLAWRQGAPAMLIVALALPMAAQALAGGTTPLRGDADRQAWSALARGDAEQAARLARDPLLAGVALYRAGDMSGAADAFARAHNASGHYNRGNALAHLGRAHDAIAAYDEALRMDPALDDAHHNRALLHQALSDDDLSNTLPGAGTSGSNGNGNAAEPDTAGATVERLLIDDELALSVHGGATAPNGIGERDRHVPNPPAGTAADGGVDEAAAREIETRQALDSWLRQIEDDPRTLLRNRFLRQLQQRTGADG